MHRRAVKQCFANVIVALVSVICFMLLAIGAIKICLYLSFSPEQEKLIEPCVPILEKLIWPLFILFLVFLFKRQLVETIQEFPAMIRRSSLPYSQLAGQKIISNNNGSTIVDSVVVESKNSKAFCQDEHDKKADAILTIIEDEIDCRIVRNACIGNTAITANGAVVFAHRLCYIAVLPSIYQGRIAGVISHMQALMKDGVKNVSVVLLICVYGSKLRMTRKDLSGFRSPTTFPVIIRCFEESDLSH